MSKARELSELGDKITVDGSGNSSFDGDVSAVNLSASGNITVTGTVDGRDVAADGTKLDGIEAGATADQTAAEIKTAYESNADTNAYTDAEKSKLAGIEAGADVTDTTNVTAAGALMDSEVTNLAAVKAFNPADYATAAQGSLADSATQPGDNISTLTNDAGYSTTTGTVTSVAATAGTGISVSGSPITGSGTLTITNTAPDQVVSLTQGSNVTITGTYPSFTIASTDTNTTYSAGSGLDLSGTTFSVEPDLRDGITHIGLDTGDYISWSNNSYTSFYVNGGERARLESDGDFHADGDLIAYSTTISDPRLKTDIQRIDNALDKLCKLSGYTFVYTPDGKASAGVMSTEVAEVLPSAIRPHKLPLKTGDSETVYDTVQYDQLHGLLIEAIKELRQEVADLKAKIEV